jgi:hypothetical protein
MTARTKTTTMTMKIVPMTNPSLDPAAAEEKHDEDTNRVTTLWLFVIFGEYQVMVQLIAKRVLISPLIHKDFPVSHLLLARGNFASVNLNHQK